MEQVVHPARKILGTLEVPGDKSISHRVLMLAAIAEGESQIENLCNGRDVQSTISCLQQLSVEIRRQQQFVAVAGRGLHGLSPPAAVLDVGNSGTTIRLLSGILAGQYFTSTLTGDASIRRRPMGRIVAPLTQMGAHVQARQGEYAPLEITGGELHPIAYTLPVASAQVKSCVLFAALYAEGKTVVREPAVTRDHTERLLGVFGADMAKDGLDTSLSGPATLHGNTFFVPGDFSSAAFFLAAGLLVPEAEVRVRKVGMNPTRTAFLRILEDMGAEITLMNLVEIQRELVADVVVQNSRLRGLEIPQHLIPQVIDEIPILTVLATQAEGETTIRGAGELRHKESDRLRAMCENLVKMGARITELEDGLCIEGPTPLRAASLASFNDHRVAMSCAVAALVADGPCSIADAECVEISYPGFFTQLDALRHD